MFHEVDFPEDLAYDSQSGPGHMTRVITQDSGYDQVVSRWSRFRNQYLIQYSNRDHLKIAQLCKFAIARGGSTYGFRLRDFYDCTSTPEGLAPELGGDAPLHTDQFLATGDGTTQIFQLIKHYDDGIRAISKPITKPISVEIALNGIGSPTSYSVDSATGLVYFANPPGIGEDITWGGEYATPVRFGGDVDRWLAGSAASFGAGNTAPLSMTEILSNISVTMPSNGFYGGGVYIPTLLGPSLTMSLSRGSYYHIDSLGGAGKVAILPASSENPGSPKGNHIFVLTISDQIYTMDAIDSLGVTLRAAMDQGSYIWHLTANGNWVSHKELTP